VHEHGFGLIPTVVSERDHLRFLAISMIGKRGVPFSSRRLLNASPWMALHYVWLQRNVFEP
jgi:hypothetical protein